MNTKTITIGAILFIVILLFAGGCSSYNGMVDADQAVSKQWGQVESQYQRRSDLIPNLVSTVKGYAAHESGTGSIPPYSALKFTMRLVNIPYYEVKP